MIYPIIAYGDPVLRKVAAEITPDYEGLDQLIEDMHETMRNSNGIGLAAPQIGKSIRLFVVDSKSILDNIRDEKDNEFRDEEGIEMTFINARLLGKSGKKWEYNEGCLSIPKIREDISREEEISLEFYDAQWKKHTRKFKGLTGRVVMHEFDHIEGKLFIDYVSPLKKRLIKSRLENISKGMISVDYKMKFPQKKLF